MISTLKSKDPDTDRLMLTPLSVLHGLHGLWASRGISQDAFFLGAQVCQKMISLGNDVTTYTGKLANLHYTVLNGTLYTGPVNKDLTLYANALQDLHFRAGLLSSLTTLTSEQLLQSPESTHFTIQESIVAGKDYSTDTQVHFYVAIMLKTSFFCKLNKSAAAVLHGRKALVIEEN